MSDSFGYTPGPAATEQGAADRIGGLLFQRVKVTFGPDGTATDVSAADPLPVTLAGTVPVSLASQPLPTGAATETTLATINAKTAALATRPVDNEAPGAPVRLVGQEVWNCGFSNVGAGVIAPEFITPITGTGVAFSQASGGLLVTTGTTANAEFLTRSVVSWRGSLRLRWSTVLSQRIANNNFAVMLADLIGEGLAVTINSATSITVTRVGHGFTAQNVGQFMHIGGIVGAAGVPGRYAIASVPTADTFNLTVAGWPASGSCTATLFGHSYARNLYTGVTATAMNVDAQRRGWASGDTTATIITTVSPGHIAQMEMTGRDVFWSDQLRASSTGPTFVSRASRYENIPDDNLDLYVFLWTFNGPTAPASTTTWTMSYCAVEKFPNTPVYIQGVRAQGSINPLPVSGAVTVSGTVTANIGTGALAAGANLIGDVGLQARANATGAGTPTPVNCPATPVAQAIKGAPGRLLMMKLRNTSASTRFVKFFNLTGAVTPGSTNAVFECAITAGAELSIETDLGVAFSIGIQVMITGAAGLNNNTAVTLGDVVGFVSFA